MGPIVCLKYLPKGISYSRNYPICIKKIHIHHKWLNLVTGMLIVLSFMQVLHQTNSEENEQTKQHQGLPSANTFQYWQYNSQIKETN